MQLFEFEDLAWFPRSWRRYIADLLQFYGVKFNPYGPVVPRLKQVLEQLNCRHIVDLCSGSSGPLLLIRRQLEEQDYPVTITLTDFFPDREAFQQAAAAAGGAIAFVETPVDARAVPPELTGFRTLFASFHHFDPAGAKQILADAARRGEGIGVFEFTGRSPLQFLPMLISPLTFWLFTPWLRPLSWARLFWTYLVPIVPLVGVWEGVASNLRTYSPAELRELVAGIEGDYTWEIGQVRSRGGYLITYLFGYPRQPALAPLAKNKF